MRQRYSFWQVFKAVNGNLTPLMPVRIGGVLLKPGIVFGRGLSFSGFDIFNVYGVDIDAEMGLDGILIIWGFFG